MESTRATRVRPPKASRPRMPGYGVPRSRRGLLPWRWAADRLRRSHNYWLVTIQPDVTPHAMPVWGIWVDDRFYFSTGRRSRKARNLARNPRCLVCTERADEAVIVHGMAAEVADRGTLERLAGPYQRKYRPWKLEPEAGPVYQVRPRIAFAIPETGFPRRASRWTFEAQASPRRRGARHGRR